MNFFFDANFSGRLVKFLSELSSDDKQEHEIVHLTGKFDKAEKDIVWISKLAEEEKEWIVITADLAILTKHKSIEHKKWEASGLTTFFFPKGFTKKSLWEQSWRTIKIWPDVLKKAERRPTNHAFEITGNWKIKDI